MFNDFREDLSRYAATKNKPRLYLLLTEQSLWAIAEYRFSRWVFTSVHLPVFRLILKIVGFIWHKLIEIVTGIDLPHKAEIGKGLYIGHFGGIFIFADVKMGEYCNISQGVTIGIGGRGEKSGCPKIGDRIFIGAGAKIIGKIIIGNDVAIGANAVVTKDLPDSSVAVGIPAKIISNKGSKDFIIC